MEKMSDFNKQMFQGHDNHTWSFIEKLSQEISNEETSTISNGSSISSLDTLDDASSSFSSSSSSSLHLNESSLLDLSDLMSQLPIKRGLSKFYNGKSESFTSLASVKSVEDLPKNPYKKMKSSNHKSYKSYTLPKPIISKKVSPFLRQRCFVRSTMNPSHQNNN